MVFESTHTAHRLGDVGAPGDAGPPLDAALFNSVIDDPSLYSAALT